MNPGTELDKAVAQAIGDPEQHDWDEEGISDGEYIVCRKCNLLHGSWKKERPTNPCYRRFSTDWNDAMWAAVQAGLFDDRDDLGYVLTRWVGRHGRESGKTLWWRVIELTLDGPIRYYERDFTKATTGPHAICLAILKLSS